MKELPGRHTTLRYMHRFGCIGPACEDHCCYAWRVDINPEAYRRLVAAASYSNSPIRKRILGAIKVIPRKSKSKGQRYTMRHGDDDVCLMMNAEGLCEIHANYGSEMLPDVCAIYPRKIKRVGDHIELSATGSCPEVCRQLLLPADGADLVDLDLDTLERNRVHAGMDTRDTRPYYRSVMRVRDFVLENLRDDNRSVEQRLFIMAWFAKRTAEILNKDRTSADMAPVEREMAMLRQSRIRDEISRRFDDVVPPAPLTLMLARALVLPGRRRSERRNWQRLVDAVVGSYTKLRDILPTGDEQADHDAAAEVADTPKVSMTVAEVWREYKHRRDRIRQRAAVAARVDQYLKHYTIHTWFHHMPVESPDVMVYTMRLLAQMATTKFMLYSHPDIQGVLDEVSEEAGAEADARVIEVLDAVAVDVYYQMARHIEHSSLLTFLETLLKHRNLYSMAGAVYLVKF